MAVKKGVKEQKKKERRGFFLKHRLCIILGCLALLIALILALVLVIRSLIATRESRETLKQLKACLSETVVSRDMTELVIPNNRCNDVVILNMGAFTKLRVLSIGNDCFGRVSSVKLSGLKALERVTIGENSFANSTGGLQVSGCEALRELSVGKDSFVKYNYVGVSGVPLLESLRVEEGSFRDGSELRLEGLSGLKKVVIGSGCFSEASGRCVIANCGVLSEVSVGNGAFAEYRALEVSGLSGLEVLRIGSGCFRNAEALRLEALSGLKRVEIGSSSFSEKSGVLSLKECERVEALTIGDGSFSAFTSFEVEGVPLLGELSVGSECFSGVSELKLEALSGLKKVEIGSGCFESVSELGLIGLSGLERVVIGENSFTKKKNGWGEDSDRHFYLKDCPKMKSLRVGRYSFSDYSSCEIENVDALEVIAMGELNSESFNFHSASLELNGLMKLKSLLVGKESFEKCDRVVFENLPVLTSVEMGWNAFKFNDDNAESALIVRNLTQLVSLTTTIESAANECFGYPRHIVLENMPSLSTVILQRAFQHSDDIQLTSCECEKGFTIRCVRFFFREASDCWQW